MTAAALSLQWFVVLPLAVLWVAAILCRLYARRVRHWYRRKDLEWREHWTSHDR